MSGFLKYRGYFGTVEYSAEDKLIHGKLAGLDRCLVMFHGENMEEFEKDFREAVDFHIETLDDEERLTNETSPDLLRMLGEDIEETQIETKVAI